MMYGVLEFSTMNEATSKDSAIDEVTHDGILRDFLVINYFCSVEKAFEKVKPIPNSVLILEKFFDLQDKSLDMFLIVKLIAVK